MEKLQTTSQTTNEKEESNKNAISLIQKHERARVARNIAAKGIIFIICNDNIIYFLDLITKSLLILARLQRSLAERISTDEEPTIEKTNKTEKLAEAAIVIQKHWRGVCARRKVKLRNEKMEELLGMTMPAWRSEKIYKTAETDNIELLNHQKAALEKLENSTKMEKERVIKDSISSFDHSD